MWLEFADNIPVATFGEISRNPQTRQVNLRNDIQSPGAVHNFVVLNPIAVFEGPTTRNLIKIGDGAYFNFGNFLSLKSFLNSNKKISLFHILGVAESVRTNGNKSLI